MKKNILPQIGRTAAFSACLLAAALLAGCAALLERSYTVTEPYADRYWDSGAEDTLRAESYQDLVNSLLLLIEERAEEGVIRCYGEVGEFREIMAAREEVRTETTPGSYLLQDMRLSHESGANYSTVSCYMTYREDAEDLSAIMTLSDSQSLVDLLRLAVREEHEKLTARFSYDISREDVAAAAESLWHELCQAEMEEAALEAAAEPLPETSPEEGDASGDAPSQPEDEGNAGADAYGEEAPPAPEQTEEPLAEDMPEDVPASGPAEVMIEYPPCPWLMRFYPNQETAEIVEIILTP